jgi:hypothetical protein
MLCYCALKYDIFQNTPYNTGARCHNTFFLRISKDHHFAIVPLYHKHPVECDVIFSHALRRFSKPWAVG